MKKIKKKRIIIIIIRTDKKVSGYTLEFVGYATKLATYEMPKKKKENETILSKLLLPVVKFTNVCEMFWLVIYIEVYVTVHNCKNKASTKMELTIIMVHKFVTLRLKQKVIVVVLK